MNMLGDIAVLSTHIQPVYQRVLFVRLDRFPCDLIAEVSADLIPGILLDETADRAGPCDHELTRGEFILQPVKFFP